MKFPGILPLVFFLFLVPALNPIIERFWPTAQYWWSAVLVAVLGAAASAGWLIYKKQLAKVDMPAPMATPIGQLPDDEDMTYTTPKAQAAPIMRTWLLG
jgi:hypothetical protein